MLKVKMLFQIYPFAGISSYANAQASWKIVKRELIFNNPLFKQCHASTIKKENYYFLFLGFTGREK